MPPLPEDDPRAARAHFMKWVTFYLDNYAAETPTQEALAKKLGVSPSAISQWRRQGSTRYPSVKNLIAFHQLLKAVFEVPVDALLYTDPPHMPGKR
jgi:DNA-binding XRE family transcriptional regulator